MAQAIYLEFEITFVAQMNTDDELQKVLLPLVLVAALFAAVAPHPGAQSLSLSGASTAFAHWREAYAASAPMLQLGN